MRMTEQVHFRQPKMLDDAVQEQAVPVDRIPVGVVRQAGRAQVTVTDTGEGIPTRDLPHIFERFYRADKARTRESGGTGLGLAIAKWIVDAHKGEIDVKSAEGKGTEVDVSLPALD